MSLNAAEVDKFEAIADQWWDVNGPSKPLHRLNPTRIAYIQRQIVNYFPNRDLADLSVLDVGCGGGLVCEPLAQLGMSVTGIDAGERAIDIAKSHAEMNGLDINYVCETVEGHKGTYDVVLALEILEHLDDIESFIKALGQKLNKGGLVVFSTLNRTPKSFALGIVAAEYIMRWLPTGTHNWKQFIKPSELARHIELNEMTVNDITGLVYNPLLNHFFLSNTDIDVNYFLTATHKNKG